MNQFRKEVSSGDLGGDRLSDPSLRLGKRIFFAIFLLVVVFSIGIRLYKADFAGITYDERANFLLFGGSLDRAVKVYTTTNNHVLNSVFMYYAHKYFRFYEHFIRIPAVLAGILFVLSLAYIIRQLIQSEMLRISALGLICLVPFVVDYSIMARGYAYGLAGTFVQMALIIWLLDHKVRAVFWWMPVVIISLMNFVAFGAILSSLLLLAAINLTFVFLYSNKIYRQKDSQANQSMTVRHQANISSRRGKKRSKKRGFQETEAGRRKVSLFDKKWFPMLLNLVSIPALSGAMLFMLYRHIYMDILNNPTFKSISRRMAGWEDFVSYLKNLLVTRVFRPGQLLSPGSIILAVIVMMLLVGMVFLGYRFIRSMKQGPWRSIFSLNDPASFIFIVTGLTIVFMFVQCVIMRRGLGLARNHVFLIPLVLLCGVVILDRLGLACGTKQWAKAIRVLIAGAVLVVLLNNFPSSVYIARQGMSGPLLRKLHAVDPDKLWNIAFTEDTDNRAVGFWYYKTNFPQKYKCNLIRTIKHSLPNYDVLICPEQKHPEGEIWYELEFFRPQKYVVLVNTAHLQNDKVARLKED